MDKTFPFKTRATTVHISSNAAIAPGNCKRIALILSKRHSHLVSDNGLGERDACFFKNSPPTD